MILDERTVWRQRLLVGLLFISGAICLLLAGGFYFYMQNKLATPSDSVLRAEPTQLIKSVDARLGLAGMCLISFAFGIFLCFFGLVLDISLRQKAIILLLTRLNGTVKREAAE